MTEPLLGVWVRTHASGKEEYEFGPSGGYAFRAYTLGKQTPDQASEGVWAVDDQFLTVDTGTVREVSPFIVDGSTFSRVQVYVRKNVTAGQSAEIVGTWEYFVQRFQVKAGSPELVLTSTRTDTLMLFGDGTSRYSSEELTPTGVSVGQSIIDRQGSWTSSGNLVIVSDDVHITEFRVVSDRIYDTNASWLYINQESPN